MKVQYKDVYQKRLVKPGEQIGRVSSPSLISLVPINFFELSLNYIIFLLYVGFHAIWSIWGLFSKRGYCAI